MVNPVKIVGPEKSFKTARIWASKLDGTVYRFKLTYIERSDNWDLQISSNSGEVVIAGARVVADWDILSPYTHDTLPPGTLICHDSLGQQTDPGRNDFNERHYFVYESPGPMVDDRDLQIQDVPEG